MLTRMASRFRRDIYGIAAAEFALILPVMVLIYVGVVDLTRSAIESRKVQNVSSTISGLVSQQPFQTQLSAATIASILSSASAIMAPYPITNITMTVSAIDLTPNVDGTCCTATVRWSYTQGGTLRPCVVPLTQVPSNAPPAPDAIPAALVKNTVLGPYASAAIIVSDVRDRYQPLFPQLASVLTVGLNRTSWVLPRSNGQVNVTIPFTPLRGQQAMSCI